MSKHSKRLLVFGTIAFFAITAAAAELYREIRPSAKLRHLDRIQDASSDLPELVRQISFDGSVDYVQFHGYSARPPSFLIASHIGLQQLQAFCALHGFDLAPSDYPIPETPPHSWKIAADFKLDPTIFAFRSNEKTIKVIVGNSPGTPSWLVQADYCPASGLIVMQLDQLSEK